MRDIPVFTFPISGLQDDRVGNADNAFKCLEQSFEERDGLMVLLKSWEWFDSLRPDTRFQDLLRIVGIP